MGKGKNGCDTVIGGALSGLSYDSLRLMVENGDTDQALALVCDDNTDHLLAIKWLGLLVDQADPGDNASRFRHLLAAVYYKLGKQNPLMLDKAIDVLADDRDDPESSRAFKGMAQRKINILSSERYRMRFSPDGSEFDQTQMLEARSAGQPVLLRAEDAGREVSMLREAFGDDQVVVAKDSTGPIGYVDDRSIIGFYSSVGIGRSFVTGSLVEAMDKGKVFVLPPHLRPDSDLAFKIESAALVGRLIDEEGREHKAAPGFMAVVMFDDKTELSGFPELQRFTKDFSDWQS